MLKTISTYPTLHPGEDYENDDHPRFGRMVNVVHSLSLTYYLTGEICESAKTNRIAKQIGEIPGPATRTWSVDLFYPPAR